MSKSKSRQTPAVGKKVTVNELLNLLPEDFIDQVACDLEVDKWVRKLKAGTVFKLVLFSLLNSERLSLRVMEDNFKAPLFQAMLPVVASDEVTWTGIRERLIKLDIGFCRRMYEFIYEQVQQQYSSASLAGYHLKRYDSTLIASFSHLLQGMKVGNTDKNKVQVKLTTEFTDDFLIQMHFHQDQAHLSEETALKEAILHSAQSAKDIRVFDRGLKSRKTFSQLHKEGILFVGRLHGSPRYELLHPFWQDDGMSDTEELEFVQDSAVYLYESGTQVLDVKLRLVQFRVKKDGQLLSFITNAWELPAGIIAEAYRRRWDIEVLFRFMKQEMNLAHFVCNDLNAIQVMLYFTMIATMLILIYKKSNGIQSYKKAKIQFFKELFYSVLYDLLESPEGLEWVKKTAKKFIQKRE